MILGQSRVPFSRPTGATPGFQPRLPNVGFYSHFHPFTMVTHAMESASAYRPPLPAPMGPTMLPDVPAPVAAPVPKAGGTAGAFGGSGFGSTGGVRGMGHMHVDPYMVMRQGVIPGVSPSGSNIRYGVTHAGQRIHRSMPFQTAALPPPPPPPLPPMPAPGAVHGLMGALGFPGGRFLRRHGAWAFGPGAGVGQEMWNRHHRHHARLAPPQRSYY